MQVKEVARKMLDLVGGREILITATHCSIRLRMVLHGYQKVDLY